MESSKVSCGPASMSLGTTEISQTSTLLPETSLGEKQGGQVTE